MLSLNAINKLEFDSNNFESKKIFFGRKFKLNFIYFLIERNFLSLSTLH